MALTEKRKAYLKAWYARNREQRRKKHLEWRNKNRDHLRRERLRNRKKINAQKRAYHWAHRKKLLAQKKADYERNKQAYIERAAKWRHANVERVRELTRNMRKRNRAKYLASKKVFYGRVKQDPTRLLNHRMGRLLYASLRLKGGGKNKTSWQKLVGYTPEKLRSHLEAKFTKGMDWTAFLRGEIHVDHIVPISWFKYDSVEHSEFKKCWALNNLQPLWARDNIIKQARWSGGAKPLRTRVR